MPPAVEVFPIQLPGRENRLREPAFTRVEPLVEELSDALLPFLDVPFALFGHSMGALVGYELAQRLQLERGLYPTHLFVSGRRAPHIPDLSEPIHALPEPEFVRKLREMEGTPEEVLQHAELLNIILPTLRADFALCETYTYSEKPLLRCPISAFGGQDDVETSADSLAAWRNLTRGEFRLYMFPGNHFFISSARRAALRAISEELARCLN